MAVRCHEGRFPPDDRLDWRKLEPLIGPQQALRPTFGQKWYTNLFVAHSWATTGVAVHIPRKWRATSLVLRK